MLIEQIKRWEALARKGFTYRADNAKTPAQDKWFSCGDDALAGRAWQGDCANLVSTVLDLCGRAGMPLSVRYFLVVEADPGDGKLVGHAVGCVADDTGALLIVGDTFGNAPYPAAQMKHKPGDYHRMSEDPETWHVGAPWVQE